jgi:hypothetical protein
MMPKGNDGDDQRARVLPPCRKKRKKERKKERGPQQLALFLISFISGNNNNLLRCTGDYIYNDNGLEPR